MIEISINEVSAHFIVFSFGFICFCIGMIYENWARKFDYKTGKRKEPEATEAPEAPKEKRDA